MIAARCKQTAISFILSFIITQTKFYSMIITLINNPLKFFLTGVIPLRATMLNLMNWYAKVYNVSRLHKWLTYKLTVYSSESIKYNIAYNTNVTHPTSSLHASHSNNYTCNLLFSCITHALISRRSQIMLTKKRLVLVELPLQTGNIAARYIAAFGQCKQKFCCLEVIVTCTKRKLFT